MTPVPERCPRTRQHFKEAEAWAAMEPWYKTERRTWMFRRGYEAAQQSCDWCNPRCPTCSHPQRRDHAPWLLTDSRAETAV